MRFLVIFFKKGVKSDLYPSNNEGPSMKNIKQSNINELTLLFFSFVVIFIYHDKAINNCKDKFKGIHKLQVASFMLPNESTNNCKLIKRTIQVAIHNTAINSALRHYSPRPEIIISFYKPALGFPSFCALLLVQCSDTFIIIKG